VNLNRNRNIRRKAQCQSTANFQQLLDFKSAPKLVEDHPMNISAKFGANLFSGFREEDLNVKS
jgi:hypothetical protein